MPDTDIEKHKPEKTTATPTPPRVAEQPTIPTKAPKSPFFISSIIVGGIILLLGLAAGATLLSKQLSTSSPENSSPLTSEYDGNTLNTSNSENSIASVAQKVSPSVVSIVTTKQVRSFYGTTSGEGAGTGIIVSKDGYIMTNNHVIDGTSTVSIVDHTGKTYENVSVVGRDPLNDVAFLKVSTTDTFSPAEIGNSATLRIGQQVVAIGNALGQYSNTVTSGIISGTGRPIIASSGTGQAESLTDLIQTDASINPGNSGGPLVNLSGQVIGINTAVATDANGIGFAIPVNATRGILKGVLETGKVNRAYIGVNYLSITPEIAREYSLPVTRGAYVYASRGTNPVMSGGPAAKAGLRSGDIITKIGGDTIGEKGSLSSIIGLYQPGDTVTITYLRGSETIEKSLTFDTYQ